MKLRTGQHNYLNTITSRFDKTILIYYAIKSRYTVVVRSDLQGKPLIDADNEGIDIQEHWIIQFSAVRGIAKSLVHCTCQVLLTVACVQVCISYTAYYLFCLHIQISSACQI